MKHKKILLVIVCVGILFLAVLANMFRGTMLMGRTDTVQAGTYHLAVFIECYRDEHGNYPSSIAEMVTAAKPDDKTYLNEILQDQFHSKYEYQLLTNGFVIAVTTPGSWFIKYERSEKRFTVGEALK